MIPKELTYKETLELLRKGKAIKHDEQQSTIIGSDGKLAVPDSVINLLCIHNLVRYDYRDKGRFVYQPPSEYAAKLKAIQDKKEQNKEQWLSFWSKKIKSSRDLNQVIEELLQWNEENNLEDEFV